MSITHFHLVADVGATNARFALVDPGTSKLQHLQIFACADYSGLASAIAAYLQLFPNTNIHKACIAIAGATHLPEFKMANNHWLVNKSEVANTLGFVPLFVNDFAAQALAMTNIPSTQLLSLKPGVAVSKGNRLVMGPGTGLGVAGLVSSQQGWLPIVGEGGHMGLAPSTALEVAVLQCLQKRFGHVSTERVMCGSGLLYLYQALAQINGQPSPLKDAAAIIKQAQTEPNVDILALQTLQVFCGLLGQAAANAALLMGSVGGVYLSGGILPRMQSFLLGSSFAERFIDKGRLSNYLESIPVYLCTAEQPGLMGATLALDA